MKHIVVCSWLVFAPQLHGQTFIVDAAGGTGSHYKDLARAVAVVPDGAVLRVRAGDYPTPFTLSNKSLSIIGDGRAVRITGRVDIGPQRAKDRVLLASLTVRGSSAPHLTVKNVPGEIVLHDVAGDTRTTYATSVLYLFDRCANVQISRSQFRGWLEFRSSSAQASFSTFVGLDGASPLRVTISPTPAVWQKGGRLQLSACNAQGGNGSWLVSCSFPPIYGTAGAEAIRAEAGAALTLFRGSCKGGAGSPMGWGCTRGYDGGAGIVLRASRLLAAGTTIAGGPGGTGARNGPPLVRDATSTAVVDPGALPPAATFSGTFARGTRIQLSVSARPRSIALLFLGLRTTFQPLEPLGLGHLFCAPALTLGLFAVPANGTLTLPVGVPKGWPLDLPACGQFLTLEAGTKTVLWGSNPFLLLAPSPSR